MTTPTCFLCKTTIKADYSDCYNIGKINLVKRFCVLVCRYLNLNDHIFHPQQTLNVYEGQDETLVDMKRESKFMCCSDDCFSAIKSFCKDFEKWKTMELMLSWKLKRIAQLMDIKECNNAKEARNSSSCNSSSDNKKECKIEKFMTLFKAEAKAKWSANPHLIVKSLPVITALTPGAPLPVKVPSVTEGEAFSSLKSSYNDIIMEEVVSVDDSPPNNGSDDAIVDDATDRSSVSTADETPMDSESDLPIEEIEETSPGLEIVPIRLKKADKKEEVKSFKCQHCSRAFAFKHSCVIHERTHTGEKPYKCNFCEKRFTVKHNWANHEKFHSGVNAFPCKFCGKNFYNKNYRDNHQKIHEGNPTFSCKFCGRGFSLERSRIDHEKIHTGEKPHKCKYCDKTFARSEGLLIHVRTHTGERPFKCDICDKRFAQSASRRTHIKTVHEGKKRIYKNNQDVQQATGQGMPLRATRSTTVRRITNLEMTIPQIILSVGNNTIRPVQQAEPEAGIRNSGDNFFEASQVFMLKKERNA